MMMMIDDCPSVFTQKLPLDSGAAFCGGTPNSKANKV